PPVAARWRARLRFIARALRALGACRARQSCARQSELTGGTRPGCLPHPHERVSLPQRAGDDTDTSLVTQGLHDEHGVRILKRDAGGVAALLERAPDAVGEVTLQRGGVEPSLEAAALAAH